MDVSTFVLGERSKCQVLQSGSNLPAAGPSASSFAPELINQPKVSVVGFPFHNCQISCYMNYNALSKV